MGGALLGIGLFGLAVSGGLREITPGPRVELSEILQEDFVWLDHLLPHRKEVGDHPVILSQIVRTAAELESGPQPPRVLLHRLGPRVLRRRSELNLDPT